MLETTPWEGYCFLLLGCDSKPRFCLLLWPSRGSFGHFWLHPTVLTDKHTLLLLFIGEQLRHKLMWRSTACSSPPLESAGMFHTRGLTCQLSPNCTLSVFFNNFSNFLHFFGCETFGGTTRTLTVFNQSFPTFESRKVSKVCVLPLVLSP
jgi:hypothetical protein